MPFLQSGVGIGVGLSDAGVVEAVVVLIGMVVEVVSATGIDVLVSDGTSNVVVISGTTLDVVGVGGALISVDPLTTDIAPYVIAPCSRVKCVVALMVSMSFVEFKTGTDDELHCK